MVCCVLYTLFVVRVVVHVVVQTRLIVFVVITWASNNLAGWSAPSTLSSEPHMLVTWSCRDTSRHRTRHGNGRDALLQMVSTVATNRHC